MTWIRYGPAFRAAGLVIACAVTAPVAAAQPAAPCTISGDVKSGSTRLPGVALTVTQGAEVVAAGSSDAQGHFTIPLPHPGQFSVTTDLLRFAPVARDVTLAGAQCTASVEIAMQLQPRVPRPAADAGVGGPRGPRAAAAARQGAPRGGGFQAVPLVPDRLSSPDVDAQAAPDGADAILPAGFSADVASDAVATIGSARATETLDVGGFGRPDGGPVFLDRAGPGGAGGIGPGGGFGGPGGGVAGGGFGPIAFGRISNRIRGSIGDSVASSGLDAAPFSLNGRPSEKADYFRQHLTGTLGGPLSVPGLLAPQQRTFFFLNYTGDHSSNPYDAYATVPTAAERSGDLSGLGVPVRDPLTGTVFDGGTIPAARLDPAAQALLASIPLPNQDGSTKNYHYVTTTNSNTDDINLRLVHSFAPRAGSQARGAGRGDANDGQPEPPGPGARIGPRGGGALGGPPALFAGAGGRRGRRNQGSTLSVALHLRRGDTGTAGVLPTLGGATTSLAWDLPVSYTSTIKGFNNALRAQFNRQRRDTTNTYANATDVAGSAGLLGVATDPFDWGVPNLSFATLSSLADPSPSRRIDRTITIGDTVSRTVGTHTVSIGGEYRLQRNEVRADANARGTFVFSGVYTGSDVADFLLGIPQQATVGYGAGTEVFSAPQWSAFVQDDWRISGTVTLNAGLRYEYQSPFGEQQDRLVTLDVDPALSSAVAVTAGGVGPYAGRYPDTIVKGDFNNVAPRVGVAWRAAPGSVVRAGYGINYSNAVYQGIAQQLANQPPFASSNTVIGTADNPLALETALTAATGTLSNTYAIDPNLTTPRVQIWNADYQKDIRRTVTIAVGYVGTRGSSLLLSRAPNRTATGLLNPLLPAFVYTSADGRSTMNALTVRLRKRFTHGVAGGVTYTLSKAMDDTSAIGGGATVLAQDDNNLGAEWGLSSFDQRHRLNADFAYELPFGPDARWANSGLASALLAHWTWNLSAQFASGTPFTARVAAAATDVAGGVNGTLRANYDGAPIALSDPTTGQWFNTLAFSVPPPGTYGTAGRNTIIGPGISTVNMRLTRSIAFDRTHTLSFDAVATNVFNTAQYSAIDTYVNSPTFGQVIGARAPRRVQLLVRYRF